MMQSFIFYEAFDCMIYVSWFLVLYVTSNSQYCAHVEMSRSSVFPHGEIKQWEIHGTETLRTVHRKMTQSYPRLE